MHDYPIWNVPVCATDVLTYRWEGIHPAYWSRVAKPWKLGQILGLLHQMSEVLSLVQQWTYHNCRCLSKFLTELYFSQGYQNNCFLTSWKIKTETFWVKWGLLLHSLELYFHASDKGGCVIRYIILYLFFISKVGWELASSEFGSLSKCGVLCHAMLNVPGAHFLGQLWLLLSNSLRPLYNSVI